MSRVVWLTILAGVSLGIAYAVFTVLLVLATYIGIALGLGLFIYALAYSLIPPKPPDKERSKTALLRNSCLRRDAPFSLRAQGMRMISGVPRAEKRFMRAICIWISAVWRSGSLAAMRSPKALRSSRFSATGSSEPARASSPRSGFGRGIPSIASRTPGRSAGWRGGFRFGRLRPGSPLSTAGRSCGSG